MARKRNTQSDIVLSTGAGSVRPRRKTARPGVTAAPAVETPATEAVAVPEAAAPVAPAHEQIARLAYSYWEARGYRDGSPEEDWVRAEQEILSLRATPAQA
jgi:hypothetical protein